MSEPIRSWRRVLLAVALTATASGTVAAAPMTLDLTAGKNYEELVVQPGGDPPSDSSSTYVVTDPQTGTQRLDNEPVLVDQTFSSLTAAGSVALDCYVLGSDGVTTNAVWHDLVLMGRAHDDRWLAETPETFATGSGGGVWTGREFGSVEGDRIWIDTTASPDEGASVTCTVGTVPGSPRGFTLSTSVTFPCMASDLPSDAGDQILGLTVGCAEDTSEVTFAYVENGGWTTVPASVCDPQVSSNWQVRITVDCELRRAVYHVRAEGATPWVLLGTASQVDAPSVTTATFRGDGAITGLRGNGFDTQLVDIRVDFDAESMVPGLDFEETVVAGRVIATEVHETDRRSGSYTVRLTDMAGNVVETQDYSFTVGGEMEFCVKASELTPGSAYRAELVLAAEVSTGTVSTNLTSVMARALTNANWGVRGQWIYENTETFDRVLPGTGVWDNREYTSVSADWIEVGSGLVTQTGAENPLSFTPTNVVEGSSPSYSVSLRVVFPEATEDVDDSDGAFGFTVASTNDAIQFMCLSNRVWQLVPRSVAAPVLGVAYELTAYVQKQVPRLDYVLTEPSGRQITLMNVELDSDLAGEFSRLDILGVGKVNDLTGIVYSTDLLRLHVDFADDALEAGTNFTATTANGTIWFEPLWATTHTNGTLRVVVRDKYGAVVGQRRISFHDLSTRRFEYDVKGLTPGETYSVDVSAEVRGIDSDTSAATGFMARTVTNDLWATDGWIREDVDTFAGRRTGSGIWNAARLAAEDDDRISINTTSSPDPMAHVSYQATNELPSHTGFELRSRLCFDMADGALPTNTGRYGVSLIDLDPADETEACRFAILSNGVWTVVSGDVYEPATKVEYEVRVRVDVKRLLICYDVSSPADAVPVVLAEYPIDDLRRLAPPMRTEFYGVGRVRTHEGDGYDVSIIELTPEFENPSLAPGTNFAETVARGVLHIRQVWDKTDKTSGDFSIIIRDVHGNVVRTETLTYTQLTNQNFDVVLDGLTAGEVYDLEVVGTLDGDPILEERFTTVMARPLGGWIRETPGTFAGEEPGTGCWYGTNGTAWAVETSEGRAIRVNASDPADPLTYDPTNDTLDVRCSTVRELRFDVDFDGAGWYATEAAPPLGSNTLAAVTVWRDDSTENLEGQETALAVVTTNGTWKILDETRQTSARQTACTVIVLIDLRAGFVRYDLAARGMTNRLHQYEFPAAGLPKLNLSFSGSGYVRSIDGDAWDPNLIRSGDEEFADLMTAIGATDEDDLLSPLWWADQLVTYGSGSFKVDDPDNLLTVRFPEWYFFEVTTNGSVRVFRYNQSNNWIDYARNTPDDIVVDGGFFLVKTPEGLSWIAALATNEWVSGRIELAGDIDLTKHNWTPIAGFSGTFDGRGRTIRGLNNSFHFSEVPGGEYLYGPTNAWGRSTYGLFGTATNAFLADVTFSQVAISNLADSVATLVGALAGDCTVSNVTVESGSLVGLGETAAGLAGFADFDGFLRVVNSTNRADVTVDAAFYGEGRWGAGLLCVAGPTDPSAPLGTLVVTNDANYGTVSGTLYDTDLLGGNLAEILVGAQPGARFGDVHLTNNLAVGAVDATLVRSVENALEVADFPAVSLAPAFWGYDANGTFLHALDANRAGAVPVDPYRRTARMLSGLFANGSVNVAGLVNDEISASLPGSTVTLTEGFDSWGPVILDRDITLDLGGFKIYTVYVSDTIVISNGVTATVRNGIIAVGPESKPFSRDETQSQLTTENLVIEGIPLDFYDRTYLEVDGEPISALYASLLTEVINSSGTMIMLYDDGNIDIDVDSGELKIGDAVVARLNDCYGFRFRTDPTTGAVIGFEVKIADSAAPTVEFATTGGEDGTVRVKVGNVQPGFWYALQYKETLDSEWMTPPTADWVRADSDGAVFESTMSGNQGYFRVMMSDTPGGMTGD